MKSSALLEPVHTAPDIKIDLHLADDCLVECRLYSASEVRLDVGVVSLSLPLAVLERLLEKGAIARDDLEMVSRYPDPLPEL